MIYKELKRIEFKSKQKRKRSEPTPTSAASASASTSSASAFTSTSTSVASASTCYPSLKSPGCIGKPNEISLQELYEAGASPTFSGTDYGLHTMSVTAPITLERYNFHLRLYRAARSGEWPNISEAHMYQLPKTHDVKSSQIRQETLATHYQRSLKWRKKYTVCKTPFFHFSPY
jgi:hypothetical protein